MSTEPLLIIASALVKDRLQKDPPPPAILYHYTSPPGLQGIVESKAFWATKINCLNDRTEFRLVVTDLVTLLGKQIGSDKDRKLFDRLRQKFEGILQHPQFYVVSLTEEPDQLSQWRAYTPQTGGYSIGFRTERLMAVLESNQSSRFGRCVYKKDERVELMIELIRPALERLRGADDDNVAELASDLATAVVILAGFVKDDSFIAEKEWRIVLGPIREHSEAPIQFRTARGYLIPHVDFRLAEDKEPLDLHSVWVGPSPQPAMAKQSLETLLKAKGVSGFEIQETRTSYRNW